MTLPEKLLELRTARGLSQGELAEELDVSRQSVSKWETGQSVPDLDKIIKLSDLYGVTVDELVREGPRPDPAWVAPAQRRAELSAIQILGIVLEATGAGMAVLGIMGAPLLAFVGAVLVVLGLPLLLAKRQPLLISGWLLAAASFLLFNPWFVRYDGWTVLGGLLYGYVTPVLLIPLARDVLMLVLAVHTWRALRQNRPS